MTGLELAAEINASSLRCASSLSPDFRARGYLRRALDVGVSGYLLKDSPATILADAVRTVHAGGRAIDRNSPQAHGPSRTAHRT